MDDLNSYDKIIVAFSGGKDSTACVLHLKELGVPRDRIELWHHDVDGDDRQFMDWPVTPSYCRSFAEALGLPLYFSWKVGGFEREMLRKNAPTAPIRLETPDGMITSGGKGPPNTRLKFPQVTANLAQRWCSAYLKVDVGRRVFSKDPRLQKGRFLFITGERRQESAARARYKPHEPHASSSRARKVTQWRSIIEWSEKEVWDIIARNGIRPHPAYYLGWGRLSCMTCIFGDKDQWASARQLAPKSFSRIAEYEKEFGLTIHRKKSVIEQADSGRPFLPDNESLKKLAMARKYSPRWIKVRRKDWELPAGAFKEAGGPT